MVDFTRFFSGVLDPDHLWIVFGVVVGLFLIMTVILLYHWRRYRFEGDKWIQPMRLIFLVLGIILLWIFYVSTATLASL